LSVMCPEEMTVALTVNLLVIVFLGGVGSLRGVLVGAVLFTALPEVLRLAPTWRLVIYGGLLLLVVVRSPERIESLLRRASVAPHRVARLGVARTFQQVSVFPRLSALENLLVFLQQHQEEHTLARLIRTPRLRRLEVEAVERARRLLDLVGLTDKADAAAGSLSYGQRKLLAFAAALMPDPDLLLLDEPAAAVNPTMINQMKSHILALHRQGKTVLLVEHNMEVVMDISQRVVVLDHGQKIAEGPPDAIRRDSRVIEAYFGRCRG